ncbi:hypothetical protein Ancab_019949 [Ancistrocladus abbreviatus]
MVPIHFSTIFLGIVMLSPPAYSQSCRSHLFTNKKAFQSCIDLSYHNAFLHWTYDDAKSSPSMAFLTPPVTPDGEACSHEPGLAMFNGKPNRHGDLRDSNLASTGKLSLRGSASSSGSTGDLPPMSEVAQSGAPIGTPGLSPISSTPEAVRRVGPIGGPSQSPSVPLGDNSGSSTIDTRGNCKWGSYWC